MDAGAGKAEWVERYLLELSTQRQLSPHTIAAYRRDLAELTALPGAAGWDAAGWAPVATTGPPATAS